MGRTVAALGIALAVGIGSASAWAEPLRRTVAVLPPERPPSLVRDVEATGSLGPKLTVGEAGDGARIVLAAAEEPASRVVERANLALNAIRTMSAEFAQVGGDGRRLTGNLYLQRPGKVRFEYDKPSTLEVVSDGSTVLVRDRKLNTSDPYPIGQTPLKFLLSTRIDLARQTTVTGVSTAGDVVRVAIEDGSTLGGTSRITLTFDKDVRELRGWRVVDPQGYTTNVSLSGIQQNAAIDPKVFMFNYMRPVE